MMKVQDMTNEQIDYWVALAQGWEIKDNQIHINGFFPYPLYKYNPSTNWAQAGQLVERFEVQLFCFKSSTTAVIYSDDDDENPTTKTADTPQRAICMAVIASVYGEEVPDNG